MIGAGSVTASSESTRVNIRLRRIYDPPGPEEGKRVLIDRLWPRGLSKAKAGVDLWAKDIAPSTELRRWYGHEADKWPEFKRRYYAELDANADGVAELLSLVEGVDVTLLFASREEQLNNAAALKEYLESRARK
jgi:uncharacterized protein YeaO (DUF488 family)